MTKHLFLPAAGAVVLLVSCEPLPSYPPPDYYRPPVRNFPRGEEPRYDDRRSYPDDRYDTRRDERPAPPQREQYPTAERTDNPNQVISPYAPYNVIDVEGFRSGQLARDPSNQKIFRVP